MVWLEGAQWAGRPRWGAGIVEHKGNPEQQEQPLEADGVTPGIVRVGQTVRRPVRTFTHTIQAHLAQRSGVGSPVRGV